MYYEMDGQTKGPRELDVPVVGREAVTGCEDERAELEMRERRGDGEPISLCGLGSSNGSMINFCSKVREEQPSP